MSDNSAYFTEVVVGDVIHELPKSFLAASAAIDNGHYPFICSSSVLKYTDRWLQDRPAVVMGTGGVASVHLGKDEFSYSTDTWGFRSSSNSVPTEFLFRKIQQYLPLIDYAGFEGSGLKHLRKDFIRKLILNVPSDTKVSNKIIKILDALDQTIDKTEALIEKYQQIKAGLMHDLFTRGIAADGKLRPPREQAPELYQETPIGWIPKEWTSLSLKERLRTPPKNGYSPKEIDDWQGLYVLGLSCLTKQGFRPIQLKNAPRHAIISGAKLKEGDFLISRANTPALVGLCGIYKDVGEETIYPDLMMKLSLENTLGSEYLELYLLFPATRVRLTALAVGTSSSMVKLNSTSIKEFKIAVPEPEEQQVIVGMMTPVINQLNFLDAQLDKLKHQKLGLMHDLLTGKVPVNINDGDAND